ncbi:9450_t:CDS:2, partial [Diversispora eburnea]
SKILEEKVQLQKDYLLRETITKQIEKDLLNESHIRIENLESVAIRQKRPYKEEIGSVIFDDEEFTIPSFILTITVDLSTLLIDTQDNDTFDNKVSCEAYIK